MRARVETANEFFMYLDTESLQIHCLACNEWVRLDEVQTVVFPEDNCQMLECPSCREVGRFEKSSPAEGRIDRLKSQFDLSPTEARDKILTILSHMPYAERLLTLGLMKNAV